MLSSQQAERLEVVSSLIASHAASIDATGEFPAKSIAALAEAGFLGTLSAVSVGGLGGTVTDAVTVVERVARECGSTAMVLCMHLSGVAVLEAHGSEEIRRAAATGAHLSTLAFSETGSRSQFWAPVSTATRDSKGFALNAQKSWITSANHATAYVWSSRPVSAEGVSTIWLVPAKSTGLTIGPRFDGMGLRGNDSTSVAAANVVVSESAMLGKDGGGLDIMLGVVLPRFNLMNAACSLGLMERATTAACAHASGTGFAHNNSKLSDLPTLRAYLARMRIKTDMVRALLNDCALAVDSGRADAMLRVLEGKAAAGETANEVLDLGMRVTGGVAFRKEVGIDRAFRDGRAAGVMAPTTDHLYDFIGKAICGLPVF
jgi:alkylation response protein AidB-like acyl-CoA dehydrogenase